MRIITHIALLVVTIVATSNVFSQKKNSFAIQTGLLNYFYDINPILINTIHIEKGKKLEQILPGMLIKSIGLTYTREINEKSNISLKISKFRGSYFKNTKSIFQAPVIASRWWYFGSIEYNRLMVDYKKVDFFYGGGVTYRFGYERILTNKFPFYTINNQVFYESHYEYFRGHYLGLVSNINVKYNFWKNLFLYSKLDLQYYFYKSFQDKLDVFTEEYNGKYKPTKNINNTLTIGFGIDF